MPRARRPDRQPERHLDDRRGANDLPEGIVDLAPLLESGAGRDLPEVQIEETEQREETAPVAAKPAPVATSIEPAFSDDDIDIPEFLK